MRVKRIENEINRTIIESNQVPDSVLDKARREMRNSSTPTIAVQMKKYYKHKLDFIVVSLAFICVLLIAITTLLSLKGNSNGGAGDSITDGLGFGDNNYGDDTFQVYLYHELTKESISSVGAYNRKYNTKFTFLKNLEVLDSYYYAKENTFVMLEENYQFQDRQLNLKIMNKNVDIYYDHNVITYPIIAEFDTHYYWYYHQDDHMYLLIVDNQIAYHFSFSYFENYEEIVRLFYKNC